MTKLDYEPRTPPSPTRWRDVFDIGCAILVLAALVLGGIGLPLLFTWWIY